MCKVNNMLISDFYCTQCGNKGIPIPRKKNAFRESGHLKKLYCIHCKKEINHCEIRPFSNYSYQNFLMEFKLGRFTEDGQRIPVEDLPICTEQKCLCCIDGKCWNTNKKNICLKEKNNEQ